MNSSLSAIWPFLFFITHFLSGLKRNQKWNSSIVTECVGQCFWNAQISLISRLRVVGSRMQGRLGAYLLTGSHMPGPRLDPFPAQWLPLWDGMSIVLFCCVHFCGVA